MYHIIYNIILVQCIERPRFWAVLQHIVSPQVDNDMYLLGTRHRHLAGHFARNQVDACRGRHLRSEDVPDVTIGVREAARLASGGRGQGFLKCSCRKLCTARCTCGAKMSPTSPSGCRRLRASRRVVGGRAFSNVAVESYVLPDAPASKMD